MIFTVDLHTHILPAVDDGAQGIDEAMLMLKTAYDNGTRHIVLTPHYLTGDSRSSGKSKAQLTETYERFCADASKVYPDLRLYLGAETFAVDNIDEVIDDGQLIAINNTKYILLEFGFVDDVLRVAAVTDKLIRRGYVPIIAHPERYKFIQNNPREIVPFLKKGALLQINSTSLAGKSGDLAQDVALSFLENEFVSVIASDAHSTSRRVPDLSDVYSFIFSEFSRDYAEYLFHNNPLAIINGHMI